MNRTGFRGVSETSWGSTWFASIYHDGRRYHLGTFLDAESAARAYDEAALRLKGSGARVNFPDDQSVTHK